MKGGPGSLPVKETTKHVPKPVTPIGTVDRSGKKKVIDVNTGKTKKIDVTNGMELDPSGNIVSAKKFKPAPQRRTPDEEG